MTFGEVLKQLRMEKGLSQQQLADRLYVDRSSVTRWESGSRLPDAFMITKISECLGTEASILLNMTASVAEKANVILVDDEKIILSGSLPIIEEVFPNAAVSGFSKPSEVISYAKKNRIDLAFLDIETGSINGLDLCRKLLEINSRTNVVFLTAYPDYSLEAWSTGACGFLVKPITAEAIRAQIPFLKNPVRGLDHD